MINGRGVLILRDQRRISIEYQFGGTFDDTRIGYLVFDTSQLDAGVFLDRLTVACDDGTEVVVAVMNTSDRHVAVVGRAVQPASCTHSSLQLSERGISAQPGKSFGEIS